ncbi:hypothetical protein [Winogradskyella alexanderae]|uniref:Uncharacterized protein n=1 Tax=Winogradskyella alexanderae TaxID=2877123 RepID=A0ABS7XUF8_9FLAO|nr:hypothetical protein [Winogradskyella alexanderae]MCA0132651.1 hypothetical protein [Winogradskyella alexanderae]
MGLELVIFIVAILFGIFIYWRESNGNGAYRRLNKIVNSKELQMSPDDPKGFVYKQSFIPRLIFVFALVLITALVVEFLTPLAVFSSYNGISAFSSFAVGTLIGTYVAHFVIKTSELVEEKSDTLGDLVEDAVEKGRDIVEDIKNKDNRAIEEVKKEDHNDPEPDKKSARERLKDKGLM